MDDAEFFNISCDGKKILLAEDTRTNKKENVRLKFCQIEMKNIEQVTEVVGLPFFFALSDPVFVPFLFHTKEN